MPVGNSLKRYLPLGFILVIERQVIAVAAIFRPPCMQCWR